jgi:hypothetical protein
VFNIHGVNDDRHTEIHIAVSEPSVFEFELAIEKLNSHKSPGINQISAEFVKARVRKILPDICKLINSILNKSKLPDEWKH